jgi:hypothetical protein
MQQRGPAGDPRATSGPRNYLLICYKRAYFLRSLIFKKIVIVISSAALRTSAAHAIDFKTLPKNVSFPGKSSVRYKLLQEQI